MLLSITITVLLATVQWCSANKMHPMTKHDQESQRPLHSRRGEHFLNQLGIVAGVDALNSQESKTSVPSFTSTETPSTPVYIALNVRSIRSIDASDESYQLRCHLYLMWGVDFVNDPE